MDLLPSGSFVGLSGNEAISIYVRRTYRADAIDPPLRAAGEMARGTAFLDEIEATLNRILEHPYAWHQLSSRTRRCRTHRFPYGLIYQIRADEVLITPVMDLSRDPDGRTCCKLVVLLLI